MIGIKRTNNLLLSALILITLNYHSVIYANPSPEDSPSATSIFGTNPIYSPGIKPTIIINEFSIIDNTLTQQKKDEYKKKIGEWALADIEYAASYNLTQIMSNLRYTLVSGAQVNPDGTLVTGDDMGKTFYYMSPTRQAFKDYLIESGKLAIDLGATHLFLNTANLDFNILSFDNEIIIAFANSINEPNYDIRTLIVSAGYLKTHQIDINDSVLTSDEHWLKWISFKDAIARDFYSGWSTALKAYAENENKTINLTANRSIESTNTINDTNNIESWITDNLLDYTLSNISLNTLDYPNKNINFAYKTSIAINKRFLSTNFPNNTDALDDINGINNSDNQPANNTDRLFIAQTFANGGLSQLGGAGWDNFINHNIKPIVTKSDYHFIQSHPEFFNLDEASDIGLLYGEYSISNDPSGLAESFKGASYLLSDAHRLWDVVFAADINRTGFGIDPLSLTKLNKYKAIVIPHTQHLSDSQVNVIEAYLNLDASHTVIGFNTIATHTEINQIAPTSRTFDNLFGVDAIDTTSYLGTVIAIASDLGKLTSDNASVAATRTANVNNFNSMVNSAELTTTLPQTTHISRFVDTSDGSHIYHIVNTNIDITTDSIIEVAAGNTLTIAVPPNYSTEPIISITSPENPTPTLLTSTVSGNNRTITLPALGLWNVIKVGSVSLDPLANDNHPWSQVHLHDSISTSIDDSFDFNGVRPDTLNSSSEFKYQDRYWKGGPGMENSLPFGLAFLATDDIGINKVEIFYRYSAEYNVWSNWFLAGERNNGINGVDVFTINTAPYGDGHYQFYTRATDSIGQVEFTSKGAETGYGIDTVGPNAPSTFTEVGGAKHGMWQDNVTNPIFSWTKPVDNMSGATHASLSIDDIENKSTLATCNDINLKTTTTINPSTCNSALDTLTSGRYGVRFQSSDAATNVGEDYDVFELRLGNKSVHDPQNVAVFGQDGKIRVTWDAPENTTNFDNVTVYITPVSSPQNIWEISSNIVIVNPTTYNSIIVGGLTNGLQYRVAIEAYDQTNALPGDFIQVADSITPHIVSYGASIIESNNSTSITEGELSDSYTIALTEQPISDVTIMISTDRHVTANPTSILFTSDNWNLPQNVNLNAIDDEQVDVLFNSVVTHTITSADINYHNLSIASVIVSVADNDVAITEPNITTDTNTGTDNQRSGKKSFWGGCTIGNKKGAFDPSLPLMLILSLFYLVRSKKET